jgi:hypothetical protein
MKTGQKVRMQIYGGEADLILVTEDKNHIYVCAEDEYRKPIQENREPTTVGFMRQFIIEAVSK